MKKLGKGMFKDTSLVDQPEGTMRDALNANLNIKKGSISNEWGTTEYPNNAGFRVLGRAVLDDDRIVMFGQQVDTVGTEITYTDQIRVLNTRNQELIVLYENNAMNFQQTHPIVTTHRKNQAGDYLVYFTDGYENEEEIYTDFEYVTNYNPPRVINVTKQLEWRFNNGAVNTLYNPTNSFYKLQLVPRVGLHSTFQSANIVEGGALPSAAYYLALAYADQDGLETNYFVVSNPVYIAPGAENTLPTNSFIGAEGGSPTNKAIQWVVNVPAGIDYQLMQPSVMKLQKTALTAVKMSPLLLPQGGNLVITYSGTEDVATIATEDIVVDNVNYITADTINQLNNRLYLANVSSNKDIGFQPFTHNIQLNAVIDTVERFSPRLYDTFILNQGYAKLVQSFQREVGQQWEDEYIFTPTTGYINSGNISNSYQEVLRAVATYDDGETRRGYRSTEFSFARKSYRRGEVYAFYISFVLNDGSETYAYHIPGRQPQCIEYSVPGETNLIYDYANWRKIVVRAVDTAVPSLTIDYTLVFSEVFGVAGYTDGIYRAEAWTGSDQTAANQFDAGTLPSTVSLSPGVWPSGNFIATNVTSGGVFGDGTGLNTLETWLNNFGPQLSGTLVWDSIVSNTLDTEQLSAILETQDTTDTVGGESGEMCENVEMNDYTYQATRAAFGFRPEEMLEQNSNLRLYQVVDTSRQAGLSTGFWENINEFYPNTPDFLRGTVTNEGNVELNPADTLAGDNVRHHKMPSNLTDYTFIQREELPSSNYSEMAQDPFTNTGPNFQITTTQRPDVKDALFVKENINILGIRLSNIKIPREILGQVQGYKIYYAKRDLKDKSVLGQSIAVPGHPRYAASPSQSLEEVTTGPFVKAFYMYGGLDHTDNSCVDTLGKWKGGFDDINSNNILQQRYLAHPVFKFHDFNMLRKRMDLSAATHVQCQYGVMFRHYSGGPGVFVKPCDYDKIWDAPLQYDMNNFNQGNNNNYIVYNYNRTDSAFATYYWFGILATDLKPWEAHATSFPSLGWVSPEMRNTVDFYWHDPRLKDDDNYDSANNLDKGLFGESRILDISDTFEGSINITFNGGNSNIDNYQTTDEAHDDSGSDGGEAKAARKWRKGKDTSQPANDKKLNRIERYLEIKAKERRVRGWWTSTMIGTTYISPSATISSVFTIKGGDRKQPYYSNTGVGNIALNLMYRESDFDDNQFTLAIEPGGKILLHGKEDHKSTDAAAFKGASILFNRSGETAHAFSLISGLPALRGHAPFDNPNSIYEDRVRAGLVRWGEAINYLYPDAAAERLPFIWQMFGAGTSANDWYVDNNEQGSLYDPGTFRGLKYTMTLNNQFYGHPMAWLLNVCAVRTDVFNPFDKQQLVWTGYYQPINDVNLANGAANDGDGNITNYYLGGDSDEIYGGDTYITKYSFRSTSQSYGHAYFRGDQWNGDPLADAIGDDPINDTGLSTYLNEGGITNRKRRFQGDLPTTLDPLRWTVDIEDRFGTTNGFPVWAYNPYSANIASNSNSAFAANLSTMDIIQDSRNWVRGNVNPVSTVFTFMCESDDLIEFRHVTDVEKGEDTIFFDYNTARDTIFEPPHSDLTHPDKMLYEDHFSALQNLKVTAPLPVFGELSKVQTFPNRVVRSDVDSGSLADGYRKFRALEFKDIPTHRGDIKNLFDLNGNLYIHTDRSLFVTKGKEQLELDAVTAFIGSGNIFVQDPDEAMQADAGHAGTTSRHAHVTTPYGHFYVNYRDKKVYNVSPQGIQDITNGMESWLRDNMPFAVEQFGINIDSEDARVNGFYVDATTGVNVPIGFTLGYDPLFKRVLITKHEPVPTEQFFTDFYAGNIVINNNIPELIDTADANCNDPETYEGFTAGRNQQVQFQPGGIVFCGPIWFGNPDYFTQRTWTISYYPELQVWGSRHSYGPNLYTNTSEFLISFAGNRSWEHTNKNNPGRFYGAVYNFEIEFIDNTGAGESKIFPNFFYWAESFLPNQNSISESFRISNPVFDEFYAYNSTQITGLPTTINYLNNARLVDRMWFINDIRDLSVQQQLTEGELITGTENVAGNITTSVTVHPQATTMFTEEGIVNNNYVNVNKEWYNRRKLIDHFMGVRLIKDNTNRNLVHLYAVGTKFRKSFR
jgi:hypothetical protein